jgi:mono/diheme cytochrome c family protein
MRRAVVTGLLLLLGSTAQAQTDPQSFDQIERGRYLAIAADCMARLVQSESPTSLIRVILEGSRSAATDQAPTAPAMPALGWKLNDAQVAAVVTYIRNSWGNAAAAVTADDVKDARGDLAARND